MSFTSHRYMAIAQDRKPSEPCRERMWLGNNARSTMRAFGATASLVLAVGYPRPKPIIGPGAGQDGVERTGRTALVELRGDPAAKEVGCGDALLQDLAVDALIDDYYVDVQAVGAPDRGTHLHQGEVEIAKQREACLHRAPDLGIGKAGRKVDPDMDIPHQCVFPRHPEQLLGLSRMPVDRVQRVYERIVDGQRPGLLDIVKCQNKVIGGHAP